jgi:AcrR family transcriptional regulator
MARSLSDEKRQALLRAAIESVAAQGASAPTATIAETAGVAEGTLFKYFPNKDALLNAVYLNLKAELRAALLADFPSKGSVKARSQHIWMSYVNWGAGYPSHRKAISQLAVSKIITDETKRLGSEGFETFHDLIRDWPGLCNPSINAGSRSSFAYAMLASIADTTIDFIAREPRHAKQFADTGFNAFWRAAAGK